MSQQFQVISPIDNSVWAEFPYTSNNELQHKLTLSQRAQHDWQKQPLSRRIEIAQRFVELMVNNKQKIGEQITHQMGRPIRYSANEIMGLQERSQYLLSIAEECLADVSAKPGGNSFMRKTPLGTVLVVAPWNYPLLTAINSILPALLSGNSVLLKHSSQTPQCGVLFEELFLQAGLPEGVLQNLYLSHQQTHDLIQEPMIAHVCFTGSVKGGKQIQKAIGERFINSALELGGKDAGYVREDADIVMAAESLVDGAFFNSGQSCCSVERIYVAAKVFDEFVHHFCAHTNDYVIANPLQLSTTLGPMVTTHAAHNIRDEKKRALAQGAQALIDEQIFGELDDSSAYVAPQVFINVNHDMHLMREENFGPIVGIMPVNSDEQALQLINDSHYGLTGSVWTRDTERAITLGDIAEVGTWLTNRCDYLAPELAWTGVKDTGKGISLSRFCFDNLTRLKSFYL